MAVPCRAAMSVASYERERKRGEAPAVGDLLLLLLLLLLSLPSYSSLHCSAAVMERGKIPHRRSRV